ncbi:class I SAM-dependent methyltransferase [Pararhodonellum marinum]|uniref:class I SAM-dependent methyltransferase n=1 Tax=Pararhodonellum marinum TaxID=2755358 RepID=UPI00188FDD26|nr:class I SAM-dependent methyltransferase [Pararhodonellum marinum]
MNVSDLNKLLGNIDIYLLDQILKGRFSKDMKILDAGCGEGRNLIYFLNEGYQVFGIDQDPLAIQMVRLTAKSIQKSYDTLRFQRAKVEEIPFHDGAFDAVLSSAVLHFADSHDHFERMFEEMMRVLKTGGLLFLRMTTGFGGMEELALPLQNGIYQLPDGSDRYLLTQEILEKLLDFYRLKELEQPKSVLVHGKRAMGVLVMEKG